MTRTEQVNYIRNLAGDISSAMLAEVAPTDARDCVEWWMSEDNFQTPEWWSEHDTNLLVKWVAKGLENPEDEK